MPPETPSVKNTPGLSLDSWAVFLALALALLVRFDLLKKIPW
jgi:hypothetical protein